MNTKPAWLSVFKLEYSSEFTFLGKIKVKYKGVGSWREKREGEMRGEKYNCMWCWKAKLCKFIFHFNTLIHPPWGFGYCSNFRYFCLTPLSILELGSNLQWYISKTQLKNIFTQVQKFKKSFKYKCSRE